MASPKKTGWRKGKFRRPGPEIHRVIYLSPKTGERIVKPRKGQAILFGHVTPDGKTYPINRDPQAADARLRTWLERQMRRKEKPVIFFQRAREVVRPGARYKPTRLEKVIDGVLHRRRPRFRLKAGESPWKPVHRLKIALPSTATKQQAQAYARGHKRQIEGGMVRHDRTEIAALRAPRFVRIGRVIEIPVRGATIWDALKGVLVDKALKRLKPWEELYYEYQVIYRDPVTGEKSVVPGRGKHGDLEGGSFRVHKSVPGGFPSGSEVMVKKLERAAWPVATQIARSVRLSLAESGVRFSSTYTLHKLKESMEERIDEAIKGGEDKKAAQLVRGLTGLEYNRPVTHGGRVLSGTPMGSLTPLRPERANGTLKQDDPGALRIKLRLTILENTKKKLDWLGSHKPKKPRKK